MANYYALKAAIQAVIKTNGAHEITGANMQATLLSIIDSLGNGYQLMGVATPSTTPPSSPDYNIAYIAGAGSYTNFGTAVVIPPTNIAIFKYNGSWACEQVTVENGGIFDITAYNNNTTYADLAAALGTGGANVPEGIRKGGMSIKFVQTSDNKYLRYNLLAQSFTTDTAQWAIAEEGVYVENPEFVYVKTDTEGKVLEGIREDGTKVIGGDLNVGGSASINGDAKILGNMEVYGVSYKVIENSEYIAAWVDEEDKIIFGIKSDGKTYIGDADFLNKIKNNQEAIEEIQSTLSSINSTIEPLDIDTLSSITTVENPEFIEAKIDSEGKLLAGRTPDGAAFENIGFTTPKVSTEAVNIDGHTIENIEDLEGRSEISTDSEGKIISYRDADGVKHENVGVATKEIISKKFNGLSISEIQSLDVRLPIVNVISPYNLIVDGNNIIGLSTSKNEVECTVEFISNEKRFTEYNCSIAYQGNSTLGDAKKGFSLVFPTKHRFKDWIEMDEYRLKGYGSSDWTSGRDVIANRLYGQVLATRNFATDKPWKKYNDFSSTSIRSLMDADKKCHMDGFPVELYINGSYWGIYVFEIRKERDNYNLDKKDNNHVQIEGEWMYADSRFTWDTVEIRNPKGYDEYVEPADGQVKTFITNWFNGISTITTSTTQIELEEYLDCQNFIDWYLHNAFICNHDVIYKNTEFTTWDNKHITLIPQDLNNGLTDWNYDKDELSERGYIYCSWLQTALTILDAPIKTRYAELREKGVFTIENLTNLWEEWCKAIGTDAYEADQKRWNRNRSSIDNILLWIENRISYLDNRFNYSQN